MKKWEKFSKEEIEQFVKESKSYAQLAIKIGYDPKSNNGSSYRAVHQMIDELSLDTAHFTGQGWNKGNFDYSRFRYGNPINSANALDAIAALRGRKCECCGLSEWLGKEIALEVHHVDGDSLNNDLSNLQILCPNCHSMTDNWKGRGIKKKGQTPIDEDAFLVALQESANIRQALLALGLTAKGGNYTTAKKIMQKYNFQFIKNPIKNKQHKEQNTCLVCGKLFYASKSSNRKYCSQECVHIAQQKVDRPDRNKLKELIRTTPFIQIGKLFNVSDKAIRKWCKSMHLPYQVSEIKKYSNQEWDTI